MKKNRTMRLAALLLVLTLITSCFVGGTFAKYTTSIDVEDEARVAYWGFAQADTLTFELFNPKDAGILNDGRIAATDDAAAYGLLAPGSSAEAKFKFEYTDYAKSKIEAPEVDYTLSVIVTATGHEGTEADTDALDANKNFVWKLDGKEYDTFAKLKVAIEDLDGNADKYEAGALPEKFYGNSENDKEHTVGWEWKFETVDEAGKADATQDAEDTKMGNATDLDDLKINITITATQVNN